METALNDSQQYEVLPREEVDDLKKQLALMSSSIDATECKLLLESKLCDAALVVYLTLQESNVNYARLRPRSLSLANHQSRTKLEGTKSAEILLQLCSQSWLIVYWDMLAASQAVSSKDFSLGWLNNKRPGGGGMGFHIDEFYQWEVW